MARGLRLGRRRRRRASAVSRWRAGAERVALDGCAGATDPRAGKTRQALGTGANTIAVGCPFCMTMLTDGTKAKNVEEQVQVKDVAELVAERLSG